MKNNILRTISIIAVLIALFCLVACGSDDTDSGANSRNGIITADEDNKEETAVETDVAKADEIPATQTGEQNDNSGSEADLDNGETGTSRSGGTNSGKTGGVYLPEVP